MPNNVYLLTSCYPCVSFKPSEMPFEPFNTVRIIESLVLNCHCALIYGRASNLTLSKTAMDIHHVYTSGIQYHSQAPSPVMCSGPKGSKDLMIMVRNQNPEIPLRPPQQTNRLLYFLWSITYALLAVWENVFFKLDLQGAAVIALLSN